MSQQCGNLVQGQVFRKLFGSGGYHLAGGLTFGEPRWRIAASMTAKEKVQAHSGLVVLRDIDCGARVQFWLLDMSAAEFEDWWRSQESFRTFDGSPESRMVYEFFGETPPPVRRLTIPGHLVDADKEADVDYWVELSGTGRFYFCNLGCDGDSYLKRPDGTKVYHKGYVPD